MRLLHIENEYKSIVIRVQDLINPRMVRPAVFDSPVLSFEGDLNTPFACAHFWDAGNEFV